MTQIVLKSEVLAPNRENIRKLQQRIEELERIVSALEVLIEDKEYEI